MWRHFQVFVISAILINFCQLELGLADDDEAYDAEMRERLQPSLDWFYEECTEETGITCRGIPMDHDCIASKDCDYAGSFWEDETTFWTDTIGPHPPKPYAVVVGYAPFQKVGNNLTARCKPKLSLQDFRIIFYKFAPEEIPIEYDGIASSGTQGFGKLEGPWTHTCNSIFRRVNGFYENDDNRIDWVDGLILGGEYVHVNKGAYPWKSSPFEGELPGFKDASQYTSQDGIVYKNF